MYTASNTDVQQQNTAVVPYGTGRGIDFNDAAPQRPDYQGYSDIDKRELIARLKERAPQWVPELFPKGRLSPDKKEWCLADITGLPPRKDGSCKICLYGDAAGCWYDFGEDNGDGPIATIREATQLYGAELWAKAAELASLPAR